LTLVGKISDTNCSNFLVVILPGSNQVAGCEFGRCLSAELGQSGLPCFVTCRNYRREVTTRVSRLLWVHLYAKIIGGRLLLGPAGCCGFTCTVLSGTTFCLAFCTEGAYVQSGTGVVSVFRNGVCSVRVRACGVAGVAS
jgi:hypothetical protein